MSENKTNLESALQRLKFVRPSDNYLAGGTSIARQSNHSHNFWNARIGVTVSAALFLSIGLNLLQISNPQSSTIESTQLITSDELQATDISETGSVFRFLCLTKAIVVSNDSFNIGELKGFGEWVFFQTPDNYQVTASLLPLRDWNAIGQFEDGVISVHLDEGEVIKLRGVGIGPSSLKRGGPFPVYGNVQKFTASNESSRLANQNTPSSDALASSPPDAPSEERAASDSNPRGITNMVAGVDTELSPLTQKYFGALIRSGECG